MKILLNNCCFRTDELCPDGKGSCIKDKPGDVM